MFSTRSRAILLKREVGGGQNVFVNGTMEYFYGFNAFFSPRRYFYCCYIVQCEQPLDDAVQYNDFVYPSHSVARKIVSRITTEPVLASKYAQFIICCIYEHEVHCFDFVNYTRFD